MRDHRVDQAVRAAVGEIGICVAEVEQVVRVVAQAEIELRIAAGDLPGTLGVERRNGAVAVRVPDGSTALAGIVATGERAGVTFEGIELVEPDLEDVFLGLTGKALRD